MAAQAPAAAASINANAPSAPQAPDAAASINANAPSAPGASFVPQPPMPTLDTDASLKAPGAPGVSPQGTPAPLPAPPAPPLPPDLHPQMANTAYQNTVTQRIQQVYQADPRMQMSGMSLQDFANYVKTHTNGFDPKAMGKILYDNPEQQSKYTHDVVIGQQLKSLPINEMIQDSTSLFRGMPFGGDLAQKDLQDSQLQSLLNDGKPMAKPEAEGLHRDLVNLARLPEQNRLPAFAALVKSKYGVDLNELQQKGAL
jgi:hypothetical protein